MNQLRREFCQRLEDEPAFVHSRMREGEARGGDDLVSVHQQIQVDDPRLPSLAADPAHFALDFEQAVEQRLRGERGFDLSDAVQERGGVRRAAHCGIFQEGRHRKHADAVAVLKPVQRVAEVRRAISKIRAQGDVSDLWRLRVHGAGAGYNAACRRSEACDMT